MRFFAAAHAGTRPVRTTRRWIILCAGLLALCLQVTARMLPPAVMAGSMRLAAITTEEARSFAATCVNLGARGDGQPTKPNDHARCPVCLTLAQAQGFAAPIGLIVATAWAHQRLVDIPAAEPIQGPVTASFASRAPPASIIA